MMRRMEKQISLSFSLRNFDGFCLCFKALTVFDRAQGAFQGTGRRYEYWVRSQEIQGHCGMDLECRNPSEPSYFSFSYPIFMFIQLHSKDFFSWIGWQLAVVAFQDVNMQIQHVFVFFFFFFPNIILLSHILCNCELLAELPQIAPTIHHVF